MTDNDAKRRELLAEARAFFKVPEATSVADVIDLLNSYGAKPIDFAVYDEDLADEFVDVSLVVGAWALTDAATLAALATDEERELFAEDPDEEFDPLEYGPDNKEWTTWAHEIDTLKRLIVVVEHDAGNRDAPGDFRVHGAGQWLRETLWAATGVLPRDPGSPTADSVLFLRAFAIDGREPGSPLPIER